MCASQLKGLSKPCDALSLPNWADSRIASTQDKKLAIVKIHRGYFSTRKDSVVTRCSGSSLRIVTSCKQEATTQERRLVDCFSDQTHFHNLIVLNAVASLLD